MYLRLMVGRKETYLGTYLASLVPVSEVGLSAWKSIETVQHSLDMDPLLPSVRRSITMEATCPLKIA